VGGGIRLGRMATPSTRMPSSASSSLAARTRARHEASNATGVAVEPHRPRSARAGRRRPPSRTPRDRCRSPTSPARADVDRGHALAVRIERKLTDTREVRARLVDIHARAGRRHQQRGLGGVAERDRSPSSGRIWMLPSLHNAPASRVSATAGPGSGTGRAAQRHVTVLDDLLDGGAMACHVDAGDGHPVLGERPGLVRADHRHRSEGLDRRQLADEGVALSIRCEPMARVRVTTAGRPSGTTATIVEMAVNSTSSTDSPLASPSPATTAATPTPNTASSRPTRSRRRCSGVSVCSTPWMSRPPSQLGGHAHRGDDAPHPARTSPRCPCTPC
jgi:hypothetical protein